MRSVTRQLVYAVLATFLIVGCDLGGASSEESSSDEPGTFSIQLKRSANSDVPSSADSALIRVWRPDGTFNLVEIANIPDPGQRTAVNLEVPANDGYRAGVLATDDRGGFSSTEKAIQAHASSDRFSVQSNDTSRVNLDVRPVSVTLRAPESIEPNQADTIEATYSINPPDTFPYLNAKQGSNSTFYYYDASDLSEVSSGETDTTAFAEFEIVGPNVEERDTTYVKVNVNPNSSGGWTTSNREIVDVIYPSAPGNFSGPSFGIPVVPDSSSSDGTIIITFSRVDGGTWEKTQWPNEQDLR